MCASGQYTTVSAFASHPLEVHKNNESIELVWVPEFEIESLDLMATFRSSLPMTSSVVQHGDVSQPTMRANESGEGALWVMPR